MAAVVVAGSPKLNRALERAVRCWPAARTTVCEC